MQLCNFRGVASGCSLFRGKNAWWSAVRRKDYVRRSESGSVRFSEVANVLQHLLIDGMIRGCYYNGMGKINAKRDLNKLYILFYVDAINVTLTQQRKQSHSIYFN